MRRAFSLQCVALIALAAALMSATPASAAERQAAKKIPVILDTDIGSDIDDTWALGMLLCRPELDVKLVVGDYGLADYRARLAAKFLQTVGRSDIPVGVGIDIPKAKGTSQEEWVKDYRLEDYPGKVHRDGVGAMIDLIMNSPEPITLISIGPMPNVAEALKREPKIAQRARLVGMYGSVRLGYGGREKPDAEWNVRADAAACRAGLSAAWDVTITPLDTCGLVQLKGDKYQKLLQSDAPVARAIVENYRIWAKTHKNAKPDEASSTLFDTVAVYLAYTQDLATMEDLAIRVTDAGHTVIDPAGKTLHVATRWKDLGAFEDHLVKTLTGK